MKLLKKINWYYTAGLATFLVFQYFISRFLGFYRFRPSSTIDEFLLFIFSMSFIIGLSQIMISLFFPYSKVKKTKHQKLKICKIVRAEHIQGFLLNEGDLYFTEKNIQFVRSNKKTGLEFSKIDVLKVVEIKNLWSRLMNKKIIELETKKHQKERFVLLNEYSHFDALESDNNFAFPKLMSFLLIFNVKRRK